MIEPAYRYRATCDRVIDGDTYHLRIDLGFHVATTIPCRLRGVDTPELGTPEGVAAKEWVARLLLVVPLIVESYRDRQSFARWIVDAWLPDGRSLADAIIDAGHGSPMKR
jgi:endonuclease YncB( thermonuclease family)